MLIFKYLQIDLNLRNIFIEKKTKAVYLYFGCLKFDRTDESMDKSLELIHTLTEKVIRMVEVQKALQAENQALQEAVQILKDERNELSEQLQIERQTEKQSTEQNELSVGMLEAEAIRQKLDVLIGETEYCIKELKGEI